LKTCHIISGPAHARGAVCVYRHVSVSLRRPPFSPQRELRGEHRYRELLDETNDFP
jgi:hypothetical protein